MKNPRQKAADTEFLSALKQLSLMMKADGAPYESHVLLQNNWATIFNGIIASGIKIPEPLEACPHINTLISALSKCGDNVSITKLENNLSIKSGKFKALIPCISTLERAFPDPSIAPLDDRLKAALAAVSVIPEEGIESVVTASVLIKGGSVVATDRKVILEFWSGCDLPTIALPKAIIDPIVKNPKKLSGFGLSNNSCSFHFEDESWIRTQFFRDHWPDVSPILDPPCNPWPLPDDFYTAVKALEPFSENGCVYFDQGLMRSHQEEGKGATYEVYGLPKGPAFLIKQLKIIQPFMQKVDFLAPGVHGNKMLKFFGENVRGTISGRVG